jgi:oxygen-independent coproporphyrinogen-3 oxidase
MKIPYYKKYNVPGPRYTSYPTVPYWDETDLRMKFGLKIKTSFQASSSSEGISLYIHLPFAKACTFVAVTSVSPKSR